MSTVATGTALRTDVSIYEGYLVEVRVEGRQADKEATTHSVKASRGAPPGYSYRHRMMLAARQVHKDDGMCGDVFGQVIEDKHSGNESRHQRTWSGTSWHCTGRKAPTSPVAGGFASMTRSTGAPLPDAYVYHVERLWLRK